MLLIAQSRSRGSRRGRCSFGVGVVAGPLTVPSATLDDVATDIPVDIRVAPLGEALAAIYEAVLAQTERITHLETIMANLEPAIARLEAAVAQILPLIGDNGEIAALLETERAANAALVQAAAELEAVEASEDVSQNAALAEQVAALEAATVATDEAFTRLETVSTSLESAVTPPVEPVQP